MTHWWRFLIILLSLSLHGLLYAASLSGKFSEDLDTDHYDCIVTLNPANNLSSGKSATITLEWSDKEPYFQVNITKDHITVLTRNGRKSTAVGKIPAGVIPGSPYALTLLRRGSTLGILHDDVLLFRGTVPRAKGKLAGISTERGWKVEEARIQRLEPVVFSDDFMRTTDDHGPWTVQSGKWALQSAWDEIPQGNNKMFANTIYSQNPFTWKGANDTRDQAAISTAGNAFWEDYTLIAAVNPGPDGACGVMVNTSDTDNGILARWSPANDHSEHGNQLALYTRVNGVQTLLASDPGGYVPGQWYRISVISALDGIRVLIDGRERIAVRDVTPWRGGVALYAEGKNGAVFDDISVYGRTLDTGLLLEKKQAQISQRFIDDNKGMQEWVTFSQEGWLFSNTDVSNFRWYQSAVFGENQWMALTVHPTDTYSGELWLTLNGDGKDCYSGYRAVMTFTGKRKKSLKYTIYRERNQLANATGPIPPLDSEYSVRFSRTGEKIWLEVDGESVLEAKAGDNPLAGPRAAYRTDGVGFMRVSDVHVFTDNKRDYTFADAPVDWTTTGTWMPSIRWSCSPNWSFLSGWSRGDAILWYKHRIAGDQSIQAFTGMKMEYPREQEIYFTRKGLFAVTLCGDGLSARTGYAGVYGAPSDTGVPCSRAVIMRNGVVVASMPIEQHNWGDFHRNWFDLRMTKRGNTIQFTVSIKQENYSLSFEDKEPINEGVPAVWTTDNSLSIARAHIEHSQPVQPRNEQQIILVEPSYPEWANQDQPLTLDFTGSWATSAKPVTQWESIPGSVPAGEERAVNFTGSRLTFVPRKIGQHWYKITGSDGTTKSPEYHLSLPVFDPAIGRDDSQALVLYRFNEAKGSLVLDQSTNATKANLTLPNNPDSVQWLPNQGLGHYDADPLVSGTPVDKLFEITKTKACTVEFWVSADTLYPPTGWKGSIVSIENPQAAIPYFAIAQSRHELVLATADASFESREKESGITTFRTSLRHVAITWDGNVTSFYIDGEKRGEQVIPWGVEQWKPGLQLYVGNLRNGSRTFLGSYYLLAIHSRCLSMNDVKRHFQAGPSAR